MSRQNRVTPLGELIADPARGLVHGNRGCLHDAEGRIRRRYAGKRWIACLLEFRGWRRSPLMQPGRYTELFFLDEATALAVGHRPCALCRHEDHVRFRGVWSELHPSDGSADEVDARLHEERVTPTGQRHHHEPFDTLPDGAFVLVDEDAYLIRGDRLVRWTAAGYEPGPPRPTRTVAEVITPPSLVELLRRGWEPVVPLFHPSSDRAAGSKGEDPSLLVQLYGTPGGWRQPRVVPDDHRPERERGG